MNRFGHDPIKILGHDPTNNFGHERNGTLNFKKIILSSIKIYS
jgi:hypothetical protein